MTDATLTTPLIPARMLNEFAYCPRLAYLEWVQGEWADNLETAQGTFGHRRVDRPDRKFIRRPKEGAEEEQSEACDDEPPKLHARSLDLSAPAEGLVAKLDLAEIEGNVATPVDYKRGRVPDVPAQAYEPERVQLCAQGLILRENGFQSDGGVLYFIASKKRVVVPFDDELVSRTRSLVSELTQATESEQMPPPLDDSPKCPRCSLVGICLPDETNFLKRITPNNDLEDHTSASTRNGLRKLLPSRDNALPLYVTKQGAFVGKSGERLTVKFKGEQLSDTKLIDVSQVALFGNVIVSAAAAKELSVRNIPICHYTYGGWFHSMTTGHDHKNVELRIRQFGIASRPEESLCLARDLIVGKIKNCRTLLRRHLGDPGADVLRRLKVAAAEAAAADSAPTLLGLEGAAARDYFQAFFPLISGPYEFDISSRNRRPPKDPVNAVLSFVYALLVKELTVSLRSVGFDPLLGFFHTPRYGRPSLALDLAEEFRPLIGDSVTLTLFNNGELTPGSFISRAGAVALTDTARKAVLAAFERRLSTEITHPIFGYKISYRRVLEVQSRLLSRRVLGDLPEYVPFTTR
ncbi:CRISPR-associated endonuclease Cas4g/Cas1g [Stratiformator vulcanicus]|uniref:CRISPR-associated endonuclease Cas1 n=1 Tax=Stratiformator vulcanicus TaxID=2527980 RepID=A0A517QWI6_9PLAN|nr:CRISPR-associated endonuclease Cas1 [Stratiformator vulcanicus]QDT36035.1 CRISPR-associated protein Cas4/endonuclease Cas1 fusion [Stratiformator vulcanicus]